MLLLSKLDPLRWTPVWFWVQTCRRHLFWKHMAETLRNCKISGRFCAQKLKIMVGQNMSQPPDPCFDPSGKIFGNDARAPDIKSGAPVVRRSGFYITCVMKLSPQTARTAGRDEPRYTVKTAPFSPAPFCPPFVFYSKSWTYRR